MAKPDMIARMKNNLPITIMVGMVIAAHLGWRKLQDVPGIGPSDPDKRSYPHMRVNVLE